MRLECFVRAVYTRENKPRLTWDANTLYKWYKIYVHGLFNPRPAQAAAYPGRGVLGWAYPSRSLPWTWKCSYKIMHSNVVHGLLKLWTNAARALFSIISQIFTAERRASQWRENEFCLHLQSGKWPIEIHDSCHSTDRCRIFRRGFRISFPIFFDQLITN